MIAAPKILAIDAACSSEMTEVTTRQFRQILKEKRTALKNALGHRDEISIVRAADILDALQLSQERSLAIESLDLNTHLLHQVEAALDRLDEGAYGSCLHCEDEIPEKRLRAIPWAVLCVSCQEKQEKLNPRHSTPMLEEAA
jgi:DnaK suppressor protein